jgi:hypothetical protein
VGPLDAAILERQMETVDPNLGYSHIRYSDGVGTLKCVTAVQHNRIKALMEALGFGPNINRPAPIPMEVSEPEAPPPAESCSL